MSKLTDTLFTLLKDEYAVVQPLADSYIESIVSNPSAENVVAQTVVFETSVVNALPNMEATAAKDVATTIRAVIDSYIPQAIADAQTAANASAAPAAQATAAAPTSGASS